MAFAMCRVMLVLLAVAAGRVWGDACEDAGVPCSAGTRCCTVDNGGATGLACCVLPPVNEAPEIVALTDSIILSVPGSDSSDVCFKRGSNTLCVDDFATVDALKTELQALLGSSISDLEGTATDLMTRVGTLENIDAAARLNTLETVNAASRLTTLEGVNAKGRLDALEAFDVNSRIGTLEQANAAQRLTTLEGVNAGSRLTTLEGVKADSRLTTLEDQDLSSRVTTLESIDIASRLGTLEGANLASRLDSAEACAKQGKIYDGTACQKPTGAEPGVLPDVTKVACSSTTKGTMGFDFQGLTPLFCDGKDWQGLATLRYGQSALNPGKDCADIKKQDPGAGNGMYYIKPVESEDAFRAYCNMLQDGGGWVMCYTTKNDIHIKTEIESNIAFGTHGYRSDCNNIPFNEVLMINHDAEDAVAHFKRREPGEVLLSATNYFTTGAAFGSWEGSGAASTSFMYQMGACDHATALAPGIWFSSISRDSSNNVCFKQCNSWCSDNSASYFRADSPDAWGEGFAWAEDGHRDVSDKLVSVGIRLVPRTGLGMTKENPGVDCSDIKAKVSNPPSGTYWIKPASTAFLAHCDMETAGGGWTICYVDNTIVHIKTETQYSVPYPLEGYRSDCRDISFNNVMYRRMSDGAFAWFAQKDGSQYKASSTNYFTTGSSFGLWLAKAGASTGYNYQLGICDHDSTLAPGFWMSGYTSSCWKACDSWCGDTSSPYFRMDSENSCYNGVAFNENGHQGCANTVSNKDMAVALRRA